MAPPDTKATSRQGRAWKSDEMSFLVRSKHDRCSRVLHNVNEVPGAPLDGSNEPRGAALGISPHAGVRGAYARGRVRLGTRSDARLEYDRRGPGMRDVAGNALTALGSRVAASEAESAVEHRSQSVRVGRQKLSSAKPSDTCYFW